MPQRRTPTEICLRPAPAEVVTKLQEEGLTPLAARVFAARGIRSREEIAPPLQSLPPPAELPGIKEMATALAHVCASREPLCIVGDYDADGVTATVIAYDCMRKLGAEVRWHIPSRYDNGYGLTPQIIEAQHAAGVRHILTVDNGTTAHEGIARAKALGVRVYVVDHHQPDGTPCAADVLVNPQVAGGAEGAFDNMVGVGLTFYLMAELRRTLGVEVHMAEYLDLVAIGTIADCGEMDVMNRTLTAGGLARMRGGKARPGVRALAASSRVGLATLSSRDIGFRIAPRINAAGRMGSADAAMHCLLAEDPFIAGPHAEKLEELNKKRLQQQDATYADALRAVDASRSGIVIGEAHWPSGIVGILAGKIAEDFRRPAFVLHHDTAGHWRGSGRAGGAVDLIAVLRAIDAAHPGMLLTFGGHRQAAGIHVREDALTKFADVFDAACAEAREPPRPVLVDALSPQDITREALEQLECIPWGQGFASPTYAATFSVLRTELTRSGSALRLQLAHADTTAAYAAICFGRSELPQTEELNALYSAQISTYNNETQFIIHSVLPHAAAASASA